MSAQECEQLMLYQEGSPASRSVLPGSEEARRMTVTSGRKCSVLLKSCGPVGLLVKMLLASSVWHSTRCFLNWKLKTTPQERLLFQLAPSTPHTGEIELQSWPTPTAADVYTGKMKSTQQKPGSRHSLNLSDAVKMFPTPTARDYKGGCKPETLAAKGRTKTNSLCDFVEGQLNPDWVEWLMGYPIGHTSLISQESQQA